MATTPPPGIDALPAAPDPNDRSTFNARAYPWSAALPTFGTQVSALGANVYANAQDAAGSALDASAQVSLAAAQVSLAAAQVSLADAAVDAAQGYATAAAVSAGSAAPQWVSGTTYAQGALVWSAVTYLTYRRKVAGGGTTDPSADSTNWQPLGGMPSDMPRSGRTSDTTLGADDKGGVIDITGGTFTQTFAAAATLGDGWWCYLRNSGTGDITLDPDASETIDGLTSFVMYPGETRLVQCDGSALHSIVMTSFYKTFTASGTFTKPPGYQRFEGEMWGGGASGRGSGSQNSSGGDGGGYAPFSFDSSKLSATETVTVGSGGGASPTTTKHAGGNSSFKNVTAYGGSSANGAGGFAYLGAATGVVIGNAAMSLYGGALSSNSAQPTSAIFGGGAGAGISSTPSAFSGGSSIFGGAGGASSLGTTTGVDGSIPGGGGGNSQSGFSGAGARGELRIWGVI